MPTILRTPDERFQHLPDYPFAPHYLQIQGARMHYVDEGTGEVILCLHGEPSWSFLYRKMIPILAKDHRVIAPDWIGFGKSDKFAEQSDYSFQGHRDSLVELIDALGLEQITLVCQDWGGLIGLRVAGEMPDRFARLVIMNTGMPDGTEPMSDVLAMWREYAANTPDLPIGMVIERGSVQSLPPEVIAAYDAPFPEARYKAGAAVFPSLIPTMPDHPDSLAMRAARESLQTWTKPALIMFSDGDPITAGGDRFFKRLLRSTEAQVIPIENAGHFLQEEQGEHLAQQILAF
ncbi:MAG: haloalkane dehalogenase, partial [Anaerolineae bacterium]|nr:haloalkane dehalogenase [Anaerolineae bacterium]